MSTVPIDSKKILEMDPNLLPRYINKNQDEEGGQGAQEQSTSLSMTKGIAALRQAQGLSNSYAPAGATREIAGMAASAQYNLGIEAAQGLTPNMTPGGHAFPSAYDDEDQSQRVKEGHSDESEGEE